MYEKRKSPCELEVERLLEAPGMKSCIRTINDILISLSPEMHKELMKEAIAYKEYG